MDESYSIGYINSLIHSQIDFYIDKGLQDYDELDVDEQIANIEPNYGKQWNTSQGLSQRFVAHQR